MVRRLRCAALALTACASVPHLGPAPQPKAAASYAAQRSFAAPAAAWPSDRWWTAYGDPQLDALIGDALAGSPDLVKAEARVRQAEAFAEMTRSTLGPRRLRRLELEQAESALAQVERKVRAYQANNGALSGQIAARQADLLHAKVELERAISEYQRRKPLADTGAVSGEELTSVKTAAEAAQAAYAQAQANLAAAQGAHAANDVLIAGVPLEENPEVTAARFRVDQARVALQRTVVRAPVDGVVSRRAVQVGEMVQPGTPLMMVVPVQQAYVSANFKEVQLRKVRVGQPAEITSDLYGGKVVYHGRVVGFSGGTGAAMAIVPAQNATGNWIKVVQRLPVRIALDRQELAAHPLKVGLSMNADIDVSR